MGWSVAEYPISNSRLTAVVRSSSPTHKVDNSYNFLCKEIIMSKQLQKQSKVIPNKQCNFVLLDTPEDVRSILSLDIIVETNHKLIEYKIGHTLSLTHDAIMKYIGGEENLIRCESGIDSTGLRNTNGRVFYVRCIT